MLVFSASNLIYANYKSIKSNTKKSEETLAFDDSIEITAEELQKSTRDLDSNIGSGGGSNNDYGSAVGNSSITGTVRDEGVRVTLVDAETGAVITKPIDFANNPMPVTRWFGSVCKLSYRGIGNSQIGLTPQNLNVGDYKYQEPTIKLPTIVNGNLSTIKSYFLDDWFLETFQNLTGITDKTVEDLKNGKYKIIIEPIGYPKIGGVYWACTATELALFDQLLNGSIRSALADFSHKNLPLSMFLEKEDFGIYPFDTNYSNQRQSNETIINKLGIGILYGKEETPPVVTPPITTPTYTYRTNTTVYTSIEISNGSCLVKKDGESIARLYPRKVTFNILGKNYPADNGDIVYPSGSKGLAYVQWTTPSKAQDIIIGVTVTYEDWKEREDGTQYWGSVTDTYEIPVSIVEIEENEPPNPVSDDRNDSWKMSSIPTISKNVTSNSWREYSAELEVVPIYNSNGDWVRDNEKWIWTTYEYTVELNAISDVYPDPLSKTAVGDTMKSGYGIRQEINSELTRKVRTTVTHLDGTVEDYTTSHSEAIPPQNVVSFFSDFNFKTYWRLLELKETSARKSTLWFKNNRFSTYNNRTHFTPIWYPDYTDYIVNSYVFDCWTPAGQLGIGVNDSVYIVGNVWDDVHVAPVPLD